MILGWLCESRPTRFNYEGGTEMRRYLLAAGVLSMLILPAGLLAQEKNVIVAEGDKLPAVKVGDVIRISASGAAGRTEISASVKGPAKLVSTANVRKFKDGKPLIGAVTKEFEIRDRKSTRLNSSHRCISYA